MNKKLRRWVIWIVGLFIILILASFLSLSIGPGGVFFSRIFHFLTTSGTPEHIILINIRLPRIIVGFAVGGALSLSGVILQSMFRNPLVEPYTLGISGGAALGVALNIVFGIVKIFGFPSLPLSGFVGGGVVILLLYFLSIKRGILKMNELLLCGVMISFISSSFIMFIMAVSGAEDLHAIVFWFMGSLDESNWVLIKSAVSVSIIGLVISYFFSSDLNAFLLGEEEAIHLGINIERSKRLLFVLASLLVGFSVSIAGIIGFVGLVVPHFMRIFVGRDHRILNLASFLSGGAFLILCDTIGRIIIAPIELPVGVITGIIGGSLFIYTIMKKRLIFG